MGPMKTDASDRDWVDDLVDLQLERPRGPVGYDGSCPNRKCWSQWHGVATPTCKGSHTITKDTPAQQTP